MEFLRDKAANTFDLGIRRDADENPLSPSQKPIGHKYILSTLSRQTFNGHNDKKTRHLTQASRSSQEWYPGLSE
jgi:hypothetical protein